MNYTRTAAVLTLAVVSAIGVSAQEADPATGDVNPVVIIINGEDVRAADISLMMQNVEGYLRSQGQTVSREQVFQVASQRVVEQKLLAQEARRFGIKADEARVAQMVQMVEQQAGGRENLAQALKGGGSNFEELEAIFRDMELGRVFIAQ